MIAPIKFNNQVILFQITNPDDHLQKPWLAGHFYEEGMLRFMLDRWNPQQLMLNRKYGPVVVDVGACIGNHTIFFAKVMKAYVYAFEPVPENVELLKTNCELNHVRPTVWIIPHGAGKDRGKANFEPDHTGNSGMGKISPSGTNVIQLIPVDHVISDSHQVDILKIDVEGYNIPVLEGARQTIENDHPEIYIECQTLEELKEVEDFLLPMGYKRWPTSFNATPTYMFYY